MVCTHALLTAECDHSLLLAPECNDFVYISDGAYTKDQILAMEQSMLGTLGFNLNAPSPLHFLRRYSKAAGSDYQIHTLCKYLIELSIMDIKLLKYPASKLAAGAVYIARSMTRTVRSIHHTCMSTVPQLSPAQPLHSCNSHLTYPELSIPSLDFHSGTLHYSLRS